MRSFSLTILGSSSALPKPDRFTTAHVLNVHERFFLIDCGEGTQIQLRRFGIPFSRIHHIFISHLHGDHFFGLPGLLSSFNLMGRKKPLTLFGPAELEGILQSIFEHMGEKPGYEIRFISISDKKPGVILENAQVTVETIALNHKKSTCGFVFRETSLPRNIRKEAVTELNLGIREIVQLKEGQDVQRADGTLLRSEELTQAPQNPRSYAFLSDTRYNEEVIPQIKHVDLLYHEATYLHNLQNRALATGHSTALEAGKIARLAEVKQLVIGHFSARYKDANVLLDEARQEFESTILAFDGLQIKC